MTRRSLAGLIAPFRVQTQAYFTLADTRSQVDGNEDPEIETSVPVTVEAGGDSNR